MGNSSVTLTPDSDSVLDPGKKVVLSEDLSFTDLDTLVDSMKDKVKNPCDSQTELAVKTKDVTDHGPDDIEVKVVLDNEILKKVKMGTPDGSDPIWLWQRVVYDREKKQFVTPVYNLPGVPAQGSPEKPLVTFYTKFAEDPLRIEFHGESEEGWCGGEREARALFGTLNDVYVQLKSTKAKVFENMPSRDNPDLLCVKSEPLDSHTNLNNMMNGMWKVMSEMFKESSSVKILKQEDEEIKVALGGETTLTLCLDREAKMIEITNEMTGTYTGKKVYKFFEDPLEVEVWREDEEGKRSLGYAFTRDVLKKINQGLENATSWGLW